MYSRIFAWLAIGVVAVPVAATGLSDGGVPQAQAQAPASDPRIFRAPGIRQPFSQADIDFMQGMIPHHAQAVFMAGWAVPSKAGDRVKLLCEKIIVSQKDEIALMQTWLRDRGLEAPAADATHHRMKMGDMVHDMLMPGMLNDAELKTLQAARGTEFDRLFLRFMIRHHQGALKMVETLFASYGAAQDDDIYKFASDVFADQEMEIERMEAMLAAIKLPEGDRP
jgi:uncharacterized protein (DUF305 family)